MQGRRMSLSIGIETDTPFSGPIPSARPSRSRCSGHGELGRVGDGGSGAPG
jgi:hypothetical protein